MLALAVVLLFTASWHRIDSMRSAHSKVMQQVRHRQAQYEVIHR
jgi:hypothetical protein